MEQVLDAPKIRWLKMESVDEAVNRCNDGIQYQLGQINTALRRQQIYREQGENENMIKMYRIVADVLDEIGMTRCQKTNELLGEMWERAGKQLRNTWHYAEHYHCFTSAMAHYKEANRHEKFLQAFRNLYRESTIARGV